MHRTNEILSSSSALIRAVSSAVFNLASYSAFIFASSITFALASLSALILASSAAIASARPVRGGCDRPRLRESSRKALLLSHGTPAPATKQNAYCAGWNVNFVSLSYQTKMLMVPGGTLILYHALPNKILMVPSGAFIGFTMLCLHMNV